MVLPPNALHRKIPGMGKNKPSGCTKKADGAANKRALGEVYWPTTSWNIAF